MTERRLALGAAGETGVTWLLKNLRAGARRTMVLLGATSLADLNPALVVRRR